LDRHHHDHHQPPTRSSEPLDRLYSDSAAHFLVLLQCRAHVEAALV
jgi:hypothetical protein